MKKIILTVLILPIILLVLVAIRVGAFQSLKKRASEVLSAESPPLPTGVPSGLPHAAPARPRPSHPTPAGDAPPLPPPPERIPDPKEIQRPPTRVPDPTELNRKN